MTIANTTIVVKKSGVSGNIPSTLANGELAINYADGKLYYKTATGTIAAISGAGANSFATINASGTLVLASSNNDILTILGSNGITVSACSTSKTVTIGDGVTFNVANSAGDFANAAFTKANNSLQLSGSASQTVTSNVTISGSLTVTGNVSISGNVNQITGNSGQFFGNTAGFGALYAGVATGYLLEPQIVTQITSNFNGYAGGINMQNINPGSNASSDLFISADNGTLNDGFLDLGLASSTYSYPGYTLIGKNDGYWIVTGNTITGGGNAIISTGLSNDIIFAQNGTNIESEVARFKYNEGLVFKSNGITFADGTKQNTAAAPYGYSNAAYSQANNISAYANAQIAIIAGIDATQNTNITSAQSFANSAFGVANSSASFANGAFVQANNISSYANAQIAIIAGVDAAQNANITSAQAFSNSAYTQANNISAYANAQILITQGVDATQNTNITSAQSFANGAFATANTKLSASGFTNNGVMYANGTGYIINGTGLTYTTNALTLTGTSTSNSVAITNSTATVNSTIIQATTATTAQTTIDTWSTTTYRTAKYLVQMTQGTNYHTIELLLVQNGTTAYLTQYGEVTTGTILGTFDASIAATTLSLLINPVSATSMTINLVRDTISV